jgi:thioredoxin-related protein
LFRRKRMLNSAMLNRAFLLAVLLLSAACLEANAAEWQTDYGNALAKAKAQNKRVLLDFTGSDWCPLCIALRQQVFSTAAFQAYAERNLILVEIDYPKRKIQPAALKFQNETLASNYAIDEKGLPTLVLLNPAGKVLREFSGYDGEGAAQIIAWLDGRLKM